MLLDAPTLVGKALFVPRTDRQAGSGTETDPYNTTAYQSPALSVTLTFEGTYATATTQTNHNCKWPSAPEATTSAPTKRR